MTTRLNITLAAFALAGAAAITAPSQAQLLGGRAGGAANNAQQQAAGQLNQPRSADANADVSGGVTAQ